MDLESVKKVLESFCKSESASNIQHLKNDKNLVNGIIQNLPSLYAHELSNPVYNSLFELYRQSGSGGHPFVLQFVPVLIWTYLSATTRRDELVYGKLEALLLAIYNAEVVNEKGEQKIKSFRLPSLSRPSIYHEPYQSSTTSSTLTETALSRHEQSETIVTLPGPGKQLNRITATHRLSVLSVILHQYNSNIVYMPEASHHSFCIMALRLAKCGFYKLCQRSKEEIESHFSSDELSRLVNHPRITLSTELIQEMTYGIYFLMYNGQRTLATKALEDLHWRASHSLLAPAHLLTDAIKHSMDQTDGLPRDGPLGLEMYLSDTQTAQPISSKTVPSVSGTVPEAPVTPGKILALSTSGMEVTRLNYEFPKDNAVDMEDIEVEVHSRKASSSSDHSAKEASKSHKKANSLGHFKLPFLSTKEHIELQPIQGSTRPNSSESPRVVLSEVNVPSEKSEDVELLATSFSDEVFDHKL
ncbi:hyccin-like isoform X2 [Orbicella faveolata]|uniref:hyccin-like isoform X2 n=1 Tax=Orbicella faveolata TaxID=48498 RepID=UPI0009E64887|nr:hyccin-like isoform X2 [Orbicella faveolata]